MLIRCNWWVWSWPGSLIQQVISRPTDWLTDERIICWLMQRLPILRLSLPSLANRNTVLKQFVMRLIRLIRSQVGLCGKIILWGRVLLWRSKSSKHSECDWRIHWSRELFIRLLLIERERKFLLENCSSYWRDVLVLVDRWLRSSGVNFKGVNLSEQNIIERKDIF